MIEWDLYEKGGINTDRLIDFLEKNITSKLRNKLIILDNVVIETKGQKHW